MDVASEYDFQFHHRHQLILIFKSLGKGCRKQESILGYDHTTLRRHMASKHKVRFLHLYFLSYRLLLYKKIPGSVSELVQEK